VTDGDVAPGGLLFTDVEGSTAHLRALGDAYPEVLARHNEIVRSAIAAEQGVEIGSEGDSIAAVLPSVAAAVRASVVAQRNLAAEPWPDRPWLVRMAVHAGAVAISDGAATGISLHEAARLRNVAHGGQVLLSEHARLAIDEAMPADIRLVDLGRHVVRDFDDRVRLHQVVAPGLQSTFPPPRTRRPRDLPSDPTSFIGRDEEVRAIDKLLSESRVVTIVGPGGSGKTRLAYAVAKRSPRESVTLVELAGVRDPSQVAATVLAATGAVDGADLREREALLVLDNCEHVLEAVAAFVGSLASGEISVLATSREALRVRGESTFMIPALAPDEAVALFRDRAEAAVDDELATAICERLAWMPLAIELAAARVRSMPLRELVVRLDDQLAILTKGARDVPRHATLRATIDWSHDLLTDEERVLFRKLSVFAGGFVLEAAEFVGEVDVVDALEGLVSKSLVELDIATDRYRMLEPVRQYAAERLRESGGEDDVHKRLVRWVRRLSSEGSVHTFLDASAARALLGPERDNVAAAIAWALDHDDLHQAAAIVIDMAWYWEVNRRGDALPVLDRMFERLDDLTRLDRAEVLRSAGMIYNDDFEDPRPVDWLLEAERILAEEQQQGALAATRFWLGRGASIRDRVDIGEPALRAAGEAFERMGHVFGWGWCVVWLAQFERHRGDMAASEALLNELLAKSEDVPPIMGAALQELAKNADVEGDLARAEARVRDALELFTTVGDLFQMGMTEMQIAELLAVSDPERAARAVVGGIRAFCASEWDVHVARGLVVAAWLLAERGEVERAATLAGAGDVGLDDLWTRWLTSRMVPVLDRVRTLLRDPALRAEVERGRRLRPIDWGDTAIEWLEDAYLQTG